MNTIDRLSRGSRRFRRMVVPLILLTAAACPLFAQTPALSDRLPASTVFFAYWHGMGAVTSAEKTNHVVQLFEDPQFAHAREALLKSMRENVAKNGPATSDKEQAEVLSLLDNPAVVGVVLNPKSDKKPATDAAPPPVTGFFIVYDAHGKTAIVEKLRAANKAKGKEVPTVMSYDFQGTKIEARATDTDVSYTALTLKYYFLADQKSVIEDLIVRFGDATPRVRVDPPVCRSRFGSRFFRAIPEPDEDFDSRAVGKTSHQVCSEFAPRSNQRVRWQHQLRRRGNPVSRGDAW